MFGQVEGLFFNALALLFVDDLLPELFLKLLLLTKPFFSFPKLSFFQAVEKAGPRRLLLLKLFAVR